MKCLVLLLLHCLDLFLADREISDRDGIAVQLEANLSTLVHTYAFWRHGDRTPIVLLPNDPENDEKSWQIGLGELTIDGIQQSFRLGKFLRQRYHGFISDSFHTSEIYVRSTNINRTLMTAEAVLQGLFPEKHLDDNLSIWHPIPVHTVEANNDMLRQNLNCPKAEEELSRVFNSKTAQEIKEKNKKLLRFIGKHMGIDGMFDFAKMWFLYDPLEVITHHSDKHRFPKWINQTLWKEIVKLYDLSCEFMYSTDLLKRLRGGGLLEEILTGLNNLQKQKLPWKQKMYAYSMHDETLAVLLAIFGIKLSTFPSYASVVLLETHWINNDFVLQLFYKNVTDSMQIYRLPIGRCDDLCSLEKLKLVTKKFITKNWKLECGLIGWIEMSVLQFGFITSVLLAVNVIIIVLCSFLRSHLKRRKIYEGRMRLPTDPEANHLDDKNLLEEQ